METLRTELVYSPVYDDRISKRIPTSPIWQECYKPGEIPEGTMYEYTIKFDGLIPVQVTNIRQYQ